MMRDFSKEYSKTGKARQKVSHRKSWERDEPGKLWKIAGVLLSLAVLVAIVASVWFGRLINDALAELAAAGTINKDLAGIQLVLQEERDNLLEPDNIEVAASKQGLQPPGPDQIRKPL